MSELDLFIDINEIDKNLLFEAVHLDIRETLLKEVCKNLKADEILYLKAKKLYFSSSDLNATKKLVKRICKCEVSDGDLSWMNMCIKAFLDKKDKRETISEETKASLLSKQKYRCAICGDRIERNNVHIDHIIPWDYVGDELKDNYQALCSDCNLHKSNHVAKTVTNIILHKQEVSI
ncbi:MAG: HNH endonuclease [Clostridia bacterium]|nr:HNH endonuclease [Clostridia bacterium]